METEKIKQTLIALEDAGEFARKHGLRQEFDRFNQRYRELHRLIEMEEPAWKTLH